MKTKFKKVGKYLLIGFLLLLGVAAIGVLYLFFVPNSSLFGICYIGKNENISSSPYSTEGVNTISLESHNMDISIIESLSDNISVKLQVNLFGFTTTEQKESNISSDFENGILNFVITEPSGLIIDSGSLIELRIPKGFTSNLIIKSNESNLNLNSDLSFNSFDLKSNSGSAHLTKGSISGSINLELGKTSLYISKDFGLTSNNVNLKVTTGKLYAEECDFGTINITENNRGAIKINDCDAITMENESAGGNIVLNNVKHLDIKSSDTNIEIKNSWSNGGSISLTKSGKVNINKITSSCSISTNDGDISISTVNPSSKTNVTLECKDDGSIEILNAYSWIDAKTKYGNISVSFAEDSLKVDENSAITTTVANSLNLVSRYLHATTYNGKITAHGVEHIEIEITNKGTANIYTNNMVGENKIKGSNGNVYIEFNSETKSAFKLSTKTNASSSINYLNLSGYQSGITDKETNNLNIFYKLTNMPTTYNSLSIVTTDGNIKVRDTATKNR